VSWSVTAEDGTAATATVAAGVTCIVAMITWRSGSPSGATWNGVAMTLVGSVNNGFENVAAGLWYLNNPDSGTHTLALSGATAHDMGLYMITGTRGETAAVRNTQSNSADNNDFIAVPTITSKNADLVFYVGDKIGNGVWSGVDDSQAGGSQGAREAGNDAGVTATFGDAGDAPICAIGTSLQIKPLAKMAGIITI